MGTARPTQAMPDQLAEWCTAMERTQVRHVYDSTSKYTFIIDMPIVPGGGGAPLPSLALADP
eukprot:7906194-Pyramimonas_sp.AAC.1